jgi:hypothetical protein
MQTKTLKNPKQKTEKEKPKKQNQPKQWKRVKGDRKFHLIL